MIHFPYIDLFTLFHQKFNVPYILTIQNGVEDTTSDAVRAWAPAYENYTFTNAGDATKFEVDIDIEE